MKHTITVIIPAYNVERFICDALDSVAAQTRLPEQVIVINDGSTDKTAMLIEQWAKNHSNINLEIIQQQNRGASAARNVGLCAASSSLTAFLDSDDLYLPHHLSKLEDAFLNHMDIVLCFGNVELSGVYHNNKKDILTGTKVYQVNFLGETSGLRVMQSCAFSSLLYGNYIPTSGNLFLTNIGRCVLFDESLTVSEDRDFWLRMSRYGTVSYYDSIVAIKRARLDNLTNSTNEIFYQHEQLKVLQKMSKLSKSLQLTYVEKINLKQALNLHAREMLYTASTVGVRCYLKKCLLLIRSKVLSPVFNLKHLVRSLS